MNNEATQKPSKKFSFLKIELIIFFIILIMGTAFYYFGQTQKQLFVSLKRLNQQNETLKTELLNTQHILNQQITLTSSNHNNFTDLQKKLGLNHKKFLLSEIEYLIRTANISLYIKHDIPTTLSLLNNAKNKLEFINNSAFDNINKKLNQDTSKLESTTKIDKTDLYLKLNTIDNQIEFLPLFLEDLKPKQTEESKKIDENSDVKGALKSSLESIKKILIIRHDEEVTPTVLSYSQRNLLNLNCHLLLSEAQSAMMQEQKEIYQISLQTLQQLIKKYFAKDNETVQKISKELSELQKINIAPELPDIRNTLKLIKDTKIKLNGKM